MSGRTRKKSPHNYGRKPLYKEHRRALILEPAELILARHSRYGAGYWMERGLHWSAEDHAAVFSLCGAASPIDACADILARPPSNIAHRARDSGLHLPEEWLKIIMPEKAWLHRQDCRARRAERRGTIAHEVERIRTSPLGRLNYPYVNNAQPEHVDLLAVNALIPKGIPDWIRADIAQNIMLALLEGETTINDLTANRASANCFIRKFYREEVDHSLVSFDHRDDERAYDEIAAAVSHETRGWYDQQDRRRAYESLKSFAVPTQVGAVYNAEIRLAQKRAHETGRYLTFDEAESEVAA